MAGPIAFDDAEIRQASGLISSALAAVPGAGYSSCGDCGSSLVADTVKLFVDQFAAAVKAEKKAAEYISASMVACADDFNQVETTNVQVSRGLMQMLSR